MITQNTPPEPPPAPSDTSLSENARYLRGVFHEIIDIAGMFLRVTAGDFAAERVAARHTGEKVDRAPYLAELERITLVMRRTAMLDMKLEEPVKPKQAQAPRDPAPREATATIDGDRPEPPEPPDRPDRDPPERPDRPDRPDRLERPGDEDLSHLPVNHALGIIRDELNATGAPAQPAAARPAPAPATAAPATAAPATAAPAFQPQTNGHAPPIQGPPPPNIRR